ncbi:SKP1-like protein 12 [Amborella trichopoda]|uniref:SKP1-like protein 12 n=1 Tax=Amborella trichopoda TaxID=13333 RepID=UPI0005D40FBC|nr:SKP1-like protein 12 [Amborella trichopoda]|eukprot:XP_011623330.1 SKP1-like protein 12 [Amborella trichopoda]
MIFLRSSDDNVFELAEEAVMQCETIKNIIEDGCTTSEKCIPLPNVSSETLSKVIEYLNHHVKDDKRKGKVGEEEKKKAEWELTEWDEKFFSNDMQTLYDITLAANYLKVKSLFDKTCMTIANHMKDWSPEEIWMTFGIQNGISPEEVEQVKMENQWAFE